VDFRILGPLEVRREEHRVPIRAGRPRKLLAALMLRLGERVRRDPMIDLLWPDDPPRNNANALWQRRTGW